MHQVAGSPAWPSLMSQPMRLIKAHIASSVLIDCDVKNFSSIWTAAVASAPMGTLSDRFNEISSITSCSLAVIGKETAAIIPSLNYMM